MDIESISLMPYCHPDWAWNYYRAWHVKRYIRCFEIALDLMDENREFTWFMDTWTDQFRVVIDNRPDLLARMKPRVAEGRLGISGGLFANPHPDRAGREAYIRNAVYGRRLFLDTFPEADLRAVTHEDVIIGHSQLPQVMGKLGFTYYQGTRSWMALEAKGVPAQFVWIGLDGSRLLTEYSVYSGITPDLIPSDFKGNWEEARKPLIERAQTRREQQGSSPNVRIIQGAGDDSLPLRDRTDKPGPYFELIEEWRKREDIEIEFSTPAWFAEKLAERSDLPEWEGQLDPVGWSYWYGQCGGDSLWRLRLLAEKKLTQAEHALVHWGDSDYPQQQMEQLWLDALSTWSHATLWLWTPDYDEFLERIKHVIREADVIRQEVHRTVVEWIAPKQEGEPIVFFNLLPWDREETAPFYHPFGEWGAAGVELVDSDGNATDVQVHHDSLHHFPQERLRETSGWARIRVPASGYATYYLRGTEQPSGRPKEFVSYPDEIDAGSIKARIDRGRISSLSLGDTDCEFTGPVDLVFEEIDESTRHQMGNRSELFGDGGDGQPPAPWSTLHYGKVVGRTNFKAHEWVAVEDGPLCVRLVAIGETAGNRTQIEATFHRGRPRIDFDVQVYVTNPVSGFLLASVALPFEGRIHVDIPWGVEERDLSQEPFDMSIIERRDYPAFWALSWADCSDDDVGAAILTEEGQQGFRTRGDRLEHFLLKTIAPENLRGQRWTTQCRTGLGCQQFKFAIVLHQGTWCDAKLYREVEEYRQPLEAANLPVLCQGNGHDCGEGLRVSPENVMVSGLYREGDRAILRLYENAGRTTEAQVSLTFEPDTVKETDFIGQDPAEPRSLSLDGCLMSVPLKPWEVVCLEIA